ncbi:MAG: response regulator [Desulfobacterales bacterium]|nr:MAG: response regulator [Desulfobacterales bacterium]
MIDLENMSILVVDDMKSMRLTIKKMLRNLNIGKTLLFADNGKKGLAILADTPCDLAIIDWNMPVMNGSEMLNALRQDKGLRDMPVIMVTSENERDIVSEVAEYEIDAYLLKPLTLESLDQKIKSVVDNANHPDACSQHLFQARELEEAGEFQGAIDALRQALVYKPSASRILRKIGLLYIKINRVDIGVKCLKKAISVNKQDTASRNHLAQIYIQKKEYNNATKIYLQILDLSQRYFGEAVRLGEHLMESGYKSEALDLFTKVIRRARRRSDLKHRIIDVALAYRELDFAIGLMEQILIENPSNCDLMFKTGDAYRNKGACEKALTFFRNVDTKKKGDPAAKLEIAKIYHQQGRIYQADNYVRQVLRIDPENEDALALRREL